MWRGWGTLIGFQVWNWNHGKNRKRRHGSDKADEISQILREQIANYDSKVQVDEVGTIISLGDGIARLHGLDKVMAGELLRFRMALPAWP
jgi:hypothetical protein